MATALSKDMRHEIDKMAPQFKMALPKHIDVDRFKRVLFTAIQRQPQLARCEPTSVYAAMMRAAEQGLIPDGRQGALVPLKGKAEFWPMWQGLLDIARLSGSIADAYVASVRENDTFEYEMGFERKLVHKPALRDRGEIIMVYAVVILPDGTKTFGPGPMTVEEVEKIRRGASSANSPAWRDHWEAMAWKTVLKRTLKYVPQSPELADAMEYDNGVTFEGEAIQAAPDERSDTETTQSGDNVQDIRERIEQHQQQLKSGEAHQDDDGRWWVRTEDGEIEYWNPDIHSANRSVTKDGHFRRRRNVAAETQTDSAPADDPPFETENQDPPMSPTWQTVVQHIEAATTVDDVQAFEDETRDYDFTHEQRQMISAAAKGRIAMLEGQ